MKTPDQNSSEQLTEQNFPSSKKEWLDEFLRREAEKIVIKKAKDSGLSGICSECKAPIIPLGAECPICDKKESS